MKHKRYNKKRKYPTRCHKKNHAEINANFEKVIEGDKFMRNVAIWLILIGIGIVFSIAVNLDWSKEVVPTWQELLLAVVMVVGIMMVTFGSIGFKEYLKDRKVYWRKIK